MQNQEDLLVVDAGGDELAGSVEPAAVRGELPASIEDGLLLRLEDLGVDVVACGEGGGAIRLRVQGLLVEQAGDRGRVHANHLLALSERYRITWWRSSLDCAERDRNRGRAEACS